MRYFRAYVALSLVLLLAGSRRLLLGVAAQTQGCFDTLSTEIKSNNNLRFFSSALAETSLDLSLAGPGPYLVFAPTDSAFSNLAEDSSVLSMELSKLMQYHISATPGYERYLAMQPGSSFSIQTLCSNCGGVSIESISSGKQILNGNVLVYEAKPVCNGILVLIDDILVPSQQSGGGSGSPGMTSPTQEIECSLEDPTCCDLPPPEFSCIEQKVWGKCDEPWMVLGNGNGGFCKYTCGRCSSRQPSYETPQGGTDDDAYDPGRSPDFGRPPRSPVDPRISCQCTEDGMSGSVDTGKSGCFNINVAEQYAENVGRSSGRVFGETVSRYFGGDASQYSNYFSGLWGSIASGWARDSFRDSTTSICYVIDPQGCATARQSDNFPGAGWRSCD